MRKWSLPRIIEPLIADLFYEVMLVNTSAVSAAIKDLEDIRSNVEPSSTRTG